MLQKIGRMLENMLRYMLCISNGRINRVSFVIEDDNSTLRAIMRSFQIIINFIWGKNLNVMRNFLYTDTYFQ